MNEEDAALPAITFKEKGRKGHRTIEAGREEFTSKSCNMRDNDHFIRDIDPELEEDLSRVQ